MSKEQTCGWCGDTFFRSPSWLRGSGPWYCDNTCAGLARQLANARRQFDGAAENLSLLLKRKTGDRATKAAQQ